MCTTFSGAVIRTTHVTGILTDIGLVLGQAIFYPRTRKHIWKLKVFLPLYGAFSLGGIIGWYVYYLLRIKAILFPCAIVGILGLTHLCYCKIFLMYKTKQTNKKHWKRNIKTAVPVPTEEPDGNTNNGYDKQINGNVKDNDNTNQQNEVENISTIQEPSDLQIISIHDSKADVITP